MHACKNGITFIVNFKKITSVKNIQCFLRGSNPRFYDKSTKLYQVQHFNIDFT